MGKWLTLYHPSRRIVTTSLDDDVERLSLLKQVGWKVGPLPPEALPDSIDELERLVAKGDLIGVSLLKKAKKAKKE